MNDDAEQVILVDAHDRETGHAPKLAAHRQGLLHRAISVSVVDAQGRLLLQRRAREKYHSGGLWTNACCTHPRPGEATDGAAERRLAEELGVVCPLHWVLRTHYRARVGVELVENEVVHLYHGVYIGEIPPERERSRGLCLDLARSLAIGSRKAARRLYLLVQTLRTFFRGSVVSRRRGLSLSDR